MLSIPWPRFFAEKLPDAGLVMLDEIESNHLTHVLRISVGATVTAFDGRGGEAQCVVSGVRKRQIELQVVQRRDTDRELVTRIDMLVALPKGDRQKHLVESLVQLGVRSLRPLITQRSVAQPVESSLVRLRRSVIDACKQCGRNRLMEIREPQRLAQLDTPGEIGRRLVAHPYGSAEPLWQLRQNSPDIRDFRVVVGPEGGLTEQEVTCLLAAGWQPVSLGDRILRVEVAAMHIASLPRVERLSQSLGEAWGRLRAIALLCLTIAAFRAILTTSIQS
jgi:16S rRNA (uracil1498-N3)-methyltransferase